MKQELYIAYTYVDDKACPIAVCDSPAMAEKLIISDFNKSVDYIDEYKRPRLICVGNLKYRISSSDPSEIDYWVEKHYMNEPLRGA